MDSKASETTEQLCQSRLEACMTAAAAIMDYFDKTWWLASDTDAKLAELETYLQGAVGNVRNYRTLLARGK